MLFVLGDSLSDVGNLAAAADFLLSQTVDPPTVGLCNPFDVFVLLRDSVVDLQRYGSLKTKSVLPSER